MNNLSLLNRIIKNKKVAYSRQEGKALDLKQTQNQYLLPIHIEKVMD